MNEEILPDLGLEVGDKVEYAGVAGEVTSVTAINDHPSLYIAVSFNQGEFIEWFLRNGKYEAWNEIPSLKLLEKKIKPKIKVTLRRYTYEHGTCLYQTGWVDGYYLDHNSTLVKTETKEIELD